MRGKLVVGNWKMNGGLQQNDALLAAVRASWTEQEDRRIAVCVPFPYLWQAQAALSGSAIAWGAQNVNEHAGGAFTGEVAAGMISEFGCTYAIVGHSERRTQYQRKRRDGCREGSDDHRGRSDASGLRGRNLGRTQGRPYRRRGTAADRCGFVAIG